MKEELTVSQLVVLQNTHTYISEVFLCNHIDFG